MLVADKPKLSNTQETAEILGLSPATLEIWRSEGGHSLQIKASRAEAARLSFRLLLPITINLTHQGLYESGKAICL